MVNGLHLLYSALNYIQSLTRLHTNSLLLHNNNTIHNNIIQFLLWGGGGVPSKMGASGLKGLMLLQNVKSPLQLKGVCALVLFSGLSVEKVKHEPQSVFGHLTRVGTFSWCWHSATAVPHCQPGKQMHSGETDTEMILT